MSIIEKKLRALYKKQDKDKIFLSGKTGYWSNLSEKENKNFLKALDNTNPMSAVKSCIPQFVDMIFSTKREAALELLDHSKAGVCIDFGCMWGVLSIGMAKRGHEVISIDQTYESLKFLSTRAKQCEFKNLHLVQDDIKKVKLKNIADFALVNGVLEWIPVIEQVYVSEFFSKKNKQNNSGPDPREMQLAFLKTVYNSLKNKGEMLLAIENRHFYQYYMGRKDPHADLLYTTWLPRFLANFISKIFRKKEYRNYIYSFVDLRKLVTESGFSSCELYSVFPDYHFPEMILEYSNKGIRRYKKYENKNRITRKQKIAYFFEIILMRYFKIKSLAPAIIIVATK